MSLVSVSVKASPEVGSLTEHSSAALGFGLATGDVPACNDDAEATLPIGLFEAGRLTCVSVLCKWAGSESGNNLLSTTCVDGDRWGVVIVAWSVGPVYVG